jgi:hypothetical protein
MLKPEAKFMESINESALPSFTSPYMDEDDPTFFIILIDVLLPKTKQSSTDKLEPYLDIP